MNQIKTNVRVFLAKKSQELQKDPGVFGPRVVFSWIRSPVSKYKGATVLEELAGGQIYLLSERPWTVGIKKYQHGVFLINSTFSRSNISREFPWKVRRYQKKWVNLCTTNHSFTTPERLLKESYWLVVSTPLKNISQNGNLPQIYRVENKAYLKPPPRLCLVKITHNL